MSILDKFGSRDYKKLNELNRKVFIKVINQDLRHLLKCIECNSYLVWDKKDDITPYWICKILYKSLTYPNIIKYNNGKHYVYLYNYYQFSKLINNLSILR